MDEAWEEVFAEFNQEAQELLDRLDVDLVALERDPSDSSIIASCFRALHTIKGSAGFMGLSDLESVAHAGEALLSDVRDGSVAVDGSIISDLLAAADALRTILKGSQGDHEELIAKLRSTRASASAAEGDDGGEAHDERDPATGVAATASEPVQEPIVDDEQAPAKRTRKPRAKKQVADAPQEDQIVEASVQPAVAAVIEPAATRTPEEGDFQPLRSDDPTRSVRVDVEVLDTLMTLVGELVLTRGQLRVQLPPGHPADATVGRLGQLTNELQDAVMRTRLQPIGVLWDKFPRLIRDLSRDLGKSARLTTDGAHTELDRSLIEALRDPMTHMVRNAMDHGIETPEERLAAGKGPEGVVSLRAWHDSGQIVVEISDDGKGVNTEKVKVTAVSRGLISSDRASVMTDEEAMDLLFAPGFSTASKVTNVSGRGVGMDVVRDSIEKIGGSVRVHSLMGMGTTIRAVIPLTLAILPALTIVSGDQRYALAQAGVEELVGGAQLDDLGEGTVIRLRGELLPVLDLSVLLGNSPTQGGSVVILRDGGRRIGLMVDSVPGAEEVVVKPMDQLLGDMPLFSGSTILGDGSVVLILDVASMVGRVGGVELGVDSVANIDKVATTGTDAILCSSGDRTIAIRGEWVERFEELELSAIYDVRGRSVVQYRGGSLPLARLDTSVESLQVVVISDGNRRLGVCVDHISDVVPLTDYSDGSGAFGDLVVEMLDINELAVRAGVM